MHRIVYCLRVRCWILWLWGMLVELQSCVHRVDCISNMGRRAIDKHAIVVFHVITSISVGGQRAKIRATNTTGQLRY